MADGVVGVFFWTPLITAGSISLNFTERTETKKFQKRTQQKTHQKYLQINIAH